MAMRTERARGAKWLAAGLLTALPLLGGCAAAVVVPMLAAGTMAAKSGTSGASEATETSVPATPTLEARVPPGATLTALSELPVPAPATGAAGPWEDFVEFALDRRQALGGPAPVASALLESPAVELPDTAPCRAPDPAVMIDLDQADSPFVPKAEARPAPGLAEALARLRSAGVAVVWVSAADANRVGEIGDLLRRTGLDPAGRDPLLLARSPLDRKQLMRREAAATVCVLAIAGDRRADFDELFDYLRDPTGAPALDVMLGEGWFLVPPPLGE